MSSLLLLSAGLKIISIAYFTDLLFSLLPVSWLGWISEKLLIAAVMMVIAAELLLGLWLWTDRHFSKALTGAMIFLMVMMIVNSYQLWLGVDDCGCLGGWIHIPPEVSIVKTSILLLITGYVRVKDNETGRV